MTTNQVLNAVVNGDFKRPRKRAPKRKIPRELEAICLKAMALDKKNRYSSVALLVRDIKDYLEGYSVSAYKGSLIRRVFKTIRRHPLIPSASIVAAITVAGILGVLKYERESRLHNLKSFAKYSIGQGDVYYLKAMKAYQKLKDEYKTPVSEFSYKHFNKYFNEFSRYKLEFNSNYNVATQFLLQAEDLGGKDTNVNKEILKILKNQLNFSLLTGDYDETKVLVNQLRLRRHRVFGEIISSEQKIFEQIKMIIRDEGIIKVDSVPSNLNVYYENFDEEDYDLDKVEDENELLGKTPFEKKISAGSYLLTLDSKNGKNIKYPIQVLCGKVNTVKIDIPEKIPKGMCYIPAGEFYFGTKRSLNQMHRGFLPAYFISKYEVTIGEYLKFWKALKTPENKHRYQARYVFSNGNFKCVDIWDANGKLAENFTPEMPIVGITAEAAEAYCSWLSKKMGVYLRLPTDLEWEKAARGVDGRLFAWGNDYDADAALCWDNREAVKKYNIAAPVGSFPQDESIYGVKDLIGNVHEFTTEKLEGNSKVFIIKGGSLRTRLQFSQCGYSSHSTASSENDIGFRYVMPISSK